MIVVRWLVVALVMAFAGATALAETPRSRQTPIAFMRAFPCPGGPDKGNTHGSCEGYVRDHMIPLCLNAPDTVANMQWQTVEDGLRKDVQERIACGRQRPGKAARRTGENAQ